MYDIALTESCFPAQRDEPVLETTVGGVLREQAARNPDAAVVLLDQFTPENMLRTLADYKCTIGFCAPTCYNMMMRLDEGGKFDISNLRIGVSAGETLHVNTTTAMGHAAGH